MVRVGDCVIWYVNPCVVSDIPVIEFLITSFHPSYVNQCVVINIPVIESLIIPFHPSYVNHQ